MFCTSRTTINYRIFMLRSILLCFEAFWGGSKLNYIKYFVSLSLILSLPSLLQYVVPMTTPYRRRLSTVSTAWARGLDVGRKGWTSCHRRLLIISLVQSRVIHNVICIHFPTIILVIPIRLIARGNSRRIKFVQHRDVFCTYYYVIVLYYNIIYYFDLLLVGTTIISKSL